MTELSIDYDTARPSPAAIKAAGYTAVWRYLDGGAVPGKSLTAAEAASLHAAGLGIGCVWETTSNRALDGAAAGTADGNAAAIQAHDTGLPHGCPLLVNVGDFAATTAEISAIHAYYHAFRNATLAWQTGGYATGYIIGELVAGGAEGLWWQNAMNDAGVPGAKVSPHASIYQRVTPTVAHPIAGVDEDAIVTPGAVHWWKAATPAPVQRDYLVVELPDGATFKAVTGTVLK